MRWVILMKLDGMSVSLETVRLRYGLRSNMSRLCSAGAWRTKMLQIL